MVYDNFEVGPIGCGASLDFSGPSSGTFPEPRILMNLLRRSNQKGAPRDTARAVISQPGNRDRISAAVWPKPFQVNSAHPTGKDTLLIAAATCSSVSLCDAKNGFACSTKASRSGE